MLKPTSRLSPIRVLLPVAKFLALPLDLPQPVGGTSSTAICSGLPMPGLPRFNAPCPS